MILHPGFSYAYIAHTTFYIGIYLPQSAESLYLGPYIDWALFR